MLEWLHGQAAAGLLRWDEDDRFELTDAAAAVLADEQDSLFFAAGAFGAPVAPDFVDDLADAFGAGLGMPFDRQGAAGVHRTERMLGPWTRSSPSSLVSCPHSTACSPSSRRAAWWRTSAAVPAWQSSPLPSDFLTLAFTATTFPGTPSTSPSTHR